MHTPVCKVHVRSRGRRWTHLKHQQVFMIMCYLTSLVLVDLKNIIFASSLKFGKIQNRLQHLVDDNKMFACMNTVRKG